VVSGRTAHAAVPVARGAWLGGHCGCAVAGVAIIRSQGSNQSWLLRSRATGDTSRVPSCGSGHPLGKRA
jgi:hypothetical protein